MLEYAGALTLACVLAPSAVWDAKYRHVPSYLIYAGYGAGAILVCLHVAYGAMEYRHMAYGLAGASLGAGMLLLGRRAILWGAADGHIIAVSSAILPLWEGIPPVLFGVAAGGMLALCASVFANVSYNLQDMRRGMFIRFDAYFFACHRKRRGERFAIGTERQRRGELRVDPDTGAISCGDANLFEPPNSEGQPVCTAIPLLAYISAGIGIILLWGVQGGGHAADYLIIQGLF